MLLQAGNVNTGHSDPFRRLIPIVHHQGGWVHVDWAFGLWANASGAQRHLVDGVELADSWGGVLGDPVQPGGAPVSPS